MLTSLIFLFALALQVQPAAAGIGKVLEDVLNKEFVPLKNCKPVETRAIDVWCKKNDKTGEAQPTNFRCRNKKTAGDPCVPISKIQDEVIKGYFGGSEYEKSQYHAMHAIVKGWVDDAMAYKCGPVLENQPAGQEYAKAWMDLEKVITARRAAIKMLAEQLLEKPQEVLPAALSQAEVQLIAYVKTHGVD